MDWSTLPDLACVTLLICAFASVSRNSQTQQSKIWLAGWVLVAVHFAVSMFLKAHGLAAELANWIELSSLYGAGVLFLWSAIPYRQRLSSRWMLATMLGGGTLYLGLVILASPSLWMLYVAAALLGVSPLAVTMLVMGHFQRPERWVVAGFYGLLAVFALMVQPRADGAFLTVSAMLFMAYLTCCMMFWFVYRKWTTGSFITIVGFLAWSLVFVIAPLMQHYLPHVPIGSEAWNLPKYVVAIGMILLLLEEQVAHNRHLALHDELTGLPNRRLFQNRLEHALAQADRREEQLALLLIDLNNFKQVNDANGHHVGDEVLKQVSSVFKKRIRVSDMVARTGGDEFSVILEGPLTRQQAGDVANALKSMLAEPLEVHRSRVDIGASVGLAMYPEDARTADALCIAADMAMYSEKNEIKDHNRKDRPDSFNKGFGQLMQG